MTFSLTILEGPQLREDVYFHSGPVSRPVTVIGRRVAVPKISKDDLDIAGRASLSVVRGIEDTERALLNDGR